MATSSSSQIHLLAAANSPSSTQNLKPTIISFPPSAPPNSAFLKLKTTLHTNNFSSTKIFNRRQNTPNESNDKQSNESDDDDEPTHITKSSGSKPSTKDTLGMKQKWIDEGLVTESLSNGMFRLRLANEDTILGYVSGRIRTRSVRILPGDRVRVELSSYDSTKGRIVYRLGDTQKKKIVQGSKTRVSKSRRTK